MPVRLLPLALAVAFSLPALGQTKPPPGDWKPSLTYELLELALEATARDIERAGARPTINSRELFLATAALYDAWAAYDAVALPSHGTAARRPVSERTDLNRGKAMLAALRVVLLDLYPAQKEWLEAQFKARGFTPSALGKKNSPEAVGDAAGQTIVKERQHDGANQLGDERGSSGKPYSDYTFYSPVNGPDAVRDVDHWQPIPFVLDSGEVVRPGFLTPHWYRVRPFALKSADQLRPPPPPKANTPQTKQELDEVTALNGSLTELGATHALMQAIDGKPGAGDDKACDVVLKLPTFSATAELAGISRVMGGYHLQVDNVVGLALGRKVSDVTWAKVSALFAGKAQ